LKLLRVPDEFSKTMQATILAVDRVKESVMAKVLFVVTLSCAARRHGHCEMRAAR